MQEEVIDQNENSEWHLLFSEPSACIDLGMKMRTMRKERSWSREDLSFLSGVSTREICRIELGKCIPNQESILKIEMAFKQRLISKSTRLKIPDSLRKEYVPLRDDLLKKRLCREEVDLTIEVGLAKADRIIREKR